MKDKKHIAVLQATARSSLVWPNVSDKREFSRLSNAVRRLVFANLSCNHIGDVEKTWAYDADSEEWCFEVKDSLVVETSPTNSRHCVITSVFTISRVQVCADLACFIEILQTQIDEWRKGLQEMRKLQLARILTTDGEEAFQDAVDRESQ